MKKVTCVIDVDSNECICVYPADTSSEKACEYINHAFEAGGYDMTIVCNNDDTFAIYDNTDNEELDVLLTFNETMMYE